jgi:hypothetical protein
MTVLAQHFAPSRGVRYCSAVADTQDATFVFAEEAAAFERWARSDIQPSEVGAREALVRITRLILAAVSLPEPQRGRLEEGAEDGVADEEWKAVAEAAGRLPLDHYGEVFDPLKVPPEEPVIGSVVDDVADIYRDVVTGLRYYRSNRRHDALWEWTFTFRHHWGQHATGAIRALNSWLAANTSA